MKKLAAVKGEEKIHLFHAVSELWTYGVLPVFPGISRHESVMYQAWPYLPSSDFCGIHF